MGVADRLNRRTDFGDDFLGKFLGRELDAGFNQRGVGSVGQRRIGLQVSKNPAFALGGR